MRYHPHSHELLAHWRDNPRRRVLWGIALVVLGSVVLLDRLAVLDLTQYLGPQARWWHFGPLLLLLSGAISVLSARSLQHALNGLLHIVLGTWVFACLAQLWGLTFTNSWPIPLIVTGVQMLVHGWFGSQCTVTKEVAQ